MVTVIFSGSFDSVLSRKAGSDYAQDDKNRVFRVCKGSVEDDRDSSLRFGINYIEAKKC